MAESGFNRQKREREFQSKVLARLEPEKNTFLKYANMPFVLWLLSAIILSLGGAYFTGYQQCIKDATDLGEKYNQLSRELFQRNDAIASIVENAKLMDDVVKQANVIPSREPELRDPHFLSIERELAKIEARMDLSGTSDIRAGQSLSPYTLPDQALFQDYAHPYVNLALTNFWILGNKDLPRLKAHVSRAREMAVAIFHVQQWTDTYPVCSFNTVLSSLLGQRPRIIYAETEPVMKGLIESEKQGFIPPDKQIYQP